MRGDGVTASLRPISLNTFWVLRNRAVGLYQGTRFSRAVSLKR